VTLLLDCISNPRNLGNLIRLACAVGADVALCGAFLSMNHAKVRAQIFTWLRPGDPIAFADVAAKVRHYDSFAQAVARFRAEGRRIIGTSPAAVKEHYDVEYLPTDVLALGHEEGGLGRIKLGLCDLAVRVPMPGGVNSLNVSDAAAVILYEALRQTRRS
jgi:tRNA G18 (ribose-2'-O)-methylase SpoU